MSDLDRLAQVLAEQAGIIEGLKRFAGAPVAVGRRETEAGGGLEQGSRTSDTGVAFDDTPAVPGREVSKGFPPAPPDQARLLDILMPRETAEQALAVYRRYLLSDHGAVYALQRAFAYMAESEGYHRGGGR